MSLTGVSVRGRGYELRTQRLGERKRRTLRFDEEGKEAKHPRCRSKNEGAVVVVVLDGGETVEIQSANSPKAGGTVDAPQRHQEQQHRLLVHMPPPQEARHRAEYDRVEEALVRRVEPEFDEERGGEGEGEDETGGGRDVREDAEGR